MLRILFTKRWVILTLVFLALIPALCQLGLWQYHRYQQTNRQNGSINASMAAPPVAMDVISKPGGTVTAADTYRTVTRSATTTARTSSSSASAPTPLATRSASTW